MMECPYRFLKNVLITTLSLNGHVDLVLLLSKDLYLEDSRNLGQS